MMTAWFKCHSSHFLFLIFFSKSLGIIDTEGKKKIIVIIMIMQIYKAPMSKIESEALVRAASRGMGERKTESTFKGR